MDIDVSIKTHIIKLNEEKNFKYVFDNIGILHFYNMFGFMDV
jgi:hypothetical protein